MEREKTDQEEYEENYREQVYVTPAPGNYIEPWSIWQLRGFYKSYYVQELVFVASSILRSFK